MPEIQPKIAANQDLLAGLTREATSKAVLLYSAGVDSTAAGMRLVEDDYAVYPLFIDYGQSSRTVEKHLGTLAAQELGFEPLKTIKTDLVRDLTTSKLLGESAQTDSDAWVPGRNTLFMVIAGIYARQIDADGICIGYMLDDNFVFGDNDYFHHKAVGDMLSKSFLQPMEVFMPVMSNTKAELIAKLHEAEVLEKTVSCWNAQLVDDQIHVCHECANCVERDQLVAQLEET